MTNKRELTMTKAIAEAIDQEMERDERVFVMRGRCRYLWRHLRRYTKSL